ncbi:MAG: HAD-IIIA family hydrolase [Candidatus Aenigmarchaeota archaeon]|nr:HAD-IIIA family hydrolase [Candidatus Aenigmarchaeota archaeon]
MRAVFLDRDGVINDGDLVHAPEQLILYENAADAIKILDALKMPVIVITNQPVVARGLCDEEMVSKINQIMLNELSKKGAKIDAVYYCPHHPQREYGGNLAYRIECGCRKPGISMLEKAAKDFSLDLSKCFFIGDSMRDMKAAENAGCKKILVKTGHAGSDAEFKTEPDFICRDILEAAKSIKALANMKALILAGGLGKRMSAVTKEAIQKTMLPINGKPILEHQIELLEKYGIENIILCTGHLSEQISEYFGDGKIFGVSIEYSHETEPLGTGGAIKNAESLIDSAFIVLCGDIFLKMDIGKFIAFHVAHGGMATMLIHETDHPQDSTIVQIDDMCRIKRIFNKNDEKPEGANLAKSSLYVLERAVLDMMPKGKHNFEDEILPMLLSHGYALYGYMTDEFIKDIGTPERYKRFS